MKPRCNHILIDGLIRNPKQWTIGKAKREVGFWKLSETYAGSTNAEVPHDNRSIISRRRDDPCQRDHRASPLSAVHYPIRFVCSARSGRFCAGGQSRDEVLTAKMQNFKSSMGLHSKKATVQAFGRKKEAKAWLEKYSVRNNLPAAWTIQNALHQGNY